MVEYIVQETSLVAIADGFRASRGVGDNLTLEEMAELAAAPLGVEEKILPTDLPDYVRSEVLEIAKKVQAVRTDDCIVFLAMSDTHQPTSDTDQTSISNLHANMAAKALTYIVPMDFVAHLGDVSNGGNGETTEDVKEQIEHFMSYFSEAYSNIPRFVAIGNHDTNIYGGTILDGDYLYEQFTALSASDDTVIDGEEYGGYCYRDFEDKNLRVFLLNTAEYIVYNGNDNATTDAQRLWFAKALAELNTKSDADNWGFIVLCHYPADYGATMPLSNLLEAYVKGGSYTVSGETVSFANHAAKFVAQFHGHIHNFLSSRLYSYSTGTSVEYNGLRVAVPNGQYNRENYYGVANTSHKIDYGEDTSYGKTPGTAEDTSFVVNVIDPTAKLIHSFCYGAGYDREIDYSFDVTYHSISKELKNSTISNAAVSVADGEAYSATITPKTGFVISGITVTMGGVNVTASVVSGNTITISEVTGDITIAVAGYTNQIPLSLAAIGSTDIYNGVGYKEGTRINSSWEEKSASGMCVTGYIPVKIGDTIRMKNVTIAGGSTPYGFIYTGTGGQGGSYSKSTMESATVDGITTLTVTGSYTGQMYFRASLGVIDGTSIITVNEEIV